MFYGVWSAIVSRIYIFSVSAELSFQIAVVIQKRSTLFFFHATQSHAKPKEQKQVMQLSIFFIRFKPLKLSSSNKWTLRYNLSRNHLKMTHLNRTNNWKDMEPLSPDKSSRLNVSVQVLDLKFVYFKNHSKNIFMQFFVFLNLNKKDSFSFWKFSQTLLKRVVVEHRFRLFVWTLKSRFGVREVMPWPSKLEKKIPKWT